MSPLIRVYIIHSFVITYSLDFLRKINYAVTAVADFLLKTLFYLKEVAPHNEVEQ